MDSFLSAVCFLTLFAVSQGFSQLWLYPEKTDLLIETGSRLRLTCVYMNDSESSVDLQFSINGAPIDASNNQQYEISVSEEKIINSTTILKQTTKNLTKSAVEMQNEGMYECSAGSYTTSIYLDVFSMTLANGMYPAQESSAPIRVECLPENVRPNVDYSVSWQRNGTKLTNDSKYNVSGTGYLDLKSPDLGDIGEYNCTVTFFPDSLVEMQENAYTVVVQAGPNIIYHDSDKHVKEGDNLDLVCEVMGYPMPEVTWLKNSKLISSATRIQVLDYKGTKGKLRIESVEASDQGMYQCFAENQIAPFNATASMEVAVEEGPKSAGNLMLQSVLVQFACWTLTSRLIGEDF